MAVILQSNGRVMLKVPDRLPDQQFWFSTISDSEIETELADRYADPETGDVHEPVATISRTPLELSAPYDDVKNYNLYRLLESSSRDELAGLKFELVEQVGSKREVYENVAFQSFMRSGTDLMGNSARMLTLRLSYTKKAV